MSKKVNKTDSEWKAELTAEQYKIARQGGTERAFTGEYWDNKEQGTYKCVCCGEPLCRSDTKYKSGSGRPSFWQPIDKEKVGISKTSFVVTKQVLTSSCRD